MTHRSNRRIEVIINNPQVCINLRRMLRSLKRINVVVDCDDKEADKLAQRITPYLISIGALNVNVVGIEEIISSRSNK